jgi:hypothetical protein
VSGPKAIETHYAGCRFRSRLEARWAVVFDHLMIPWQYEPQGYELPSGRYLPDFRAESTKGNPYFIEIKGPMPDAREFQVASEINLLVAPLVILQGDLPRRRGEGTAWVFQQTGKNQYDWVMTDPEKALIWGALGPKGHPGEIGMELWNEAVTAGRSARFEHGESG